MMPKIPIADDAPVIRTPAEFEIITLIRRRVRTCPQYAMKTFEK
jgi:hypothetical protein